MRANRWRHAFAVAVTFMLLLFGLASSADATTDDSAKGKTCQVQGNPPPDGAQIPTPFLKIPFSEHDAHGSLAVTNGWQMAEDEIPIAGPDPHRALDLEFVNSRDHGYGLPVYAAADGRAYFTYQYISEELNGHQYGLGAGLVVEVRHANGFVTQYIHLRDVASGLPYLQPTPNGAHDWVPSGLFQDNQTLWNLGVPVQQGQLLGWQGDTGIGFDWYDQFDPTTGRVAPRDRVAQPPWDPEQLHFSVYQGRVNGVKQNILDPSGLYAQITAGNNPYTEKPGTLCADPTRSLWLTDRHGRILYARK